MHTILVERRIPAPPEAVFDLLADHAGYTRFPGVRSAKLVREGKPERNGTGAIREISAGLAWFREEITGYERPSRLDYRILASRPPLEHDGGTIRLAPTPEGTHVTWTSSFEVRLPLIGGIATVIMAALLTRAFQDMLRHIEQHLTAGG